MRGVDYIAENLMRGEDFRAALGTTAHRLWFRVRRDSLHVELGCGKWPAPGGLVWDYGCVMMVPYGSGVGARMECCRCAFKRKSSAPSRIRTYEVVHVITNSLCRGKTSAPRKSFRKLIFSGIGIGVSCIQCK